MKLEFIIEKTTTIKEFIYTNISRNFFGYLKEHNVIYSVNGLERKSYEEVKFNEILTITYDDKNEIYGIPSDKSLEIVYEDEYYIVIDKPSKLQSIPSKANPYDSVFNRLLYYFTGTNNTIHLINRLDKETRGLVLIAKNNFSRAILKDFNKVYIAMTNIKLNDNKGIIDLPIARVSNSIRRTVSEEGQKAITCYELIEESNGIFSYKIELKTGRTHQIRVHFSHLGSPLINDTLYGCYFTDDKELGLICRNINFYHPIRKEYINLKSKY